MDLLLIIRGLAAIAVVIWHSGGYQADLPFINLPGRTAVWIFFGISGYVIAYGFVHKRYLLNKLGLKHFYLNRFLRIYPLFILLSMLGWITIWIKSGVSPIGWTDIPSQFFALQFNHHYPLNSVFWTLGLEIQFYVMAPALMTLFTIKDAKRQWLAIFACYTAVLIFNWLAVRYIGWSFDGRNIISVLPHFFVGIAGCKLVASLKRSNAKAFLYLMCALACLITSNWLYHKQPESFWSIRGIVLVDAMILLFIFSHASFTSLNASKTISAKLMSALLLMGTLSYGIYAWHAYLMSSILWLSTHWWGLLPVSIAFAFASYQWVESPSLKLKRWQNPLKTLSK